MDLLTIATRDDWTCWICGGDVDPGSPPGSSHAPSVDHVVPRARGGGNEPTNLRLAHRRCNGRRGSRLPELEWPASLGVIDPAPLWQTLRRARRRPGDWETVGLAASAERADEAAAWAVDAAALVLGGAWESRVTSSATGVHLVALRACP